MKLITQLFCPDPHTCTTITWPLSDLWPLNLCAHTTAWPTLAALLSPRHHASMCPSLPADWRPDSGGQRPQLSQRPARRSRQSPEVVPAPDDDGQRCRPPATRQDSGRRNQVDRQLADRWEFSQQQRGRVSVLCQKHTFGKIVHAGPQVNVKAECRKKLIIITL